MKKNYIVPAVETAKFRAGVLCKDSMKLDDTNPVGGGGALTRQLWTEEED